MPVPPKASEGESLRDSSCRIFTGRMPLLSLNQQYEEGSYRSWKFLEFKPHFPSLESPGIRPRSWKVVEMRIVGVTNISMISLNDC